MGRLRKCKGKATVYVDGKYQPLEFPLGYFHQWGSNYEEFEAGPGNFSVAIVELPDGRVVMPSADNIVFLDSPCNNNEEDEPDSYECKETEHEKDFESAYSEDELCQHDEDREEVQECPHHLMGLCSSDDRHNECPCEG